MPPFTERLADGWEQAQSHLPLALVPLVTALLDADKIGKIVAADGHHFGLRVGLPATVVNLWQFVSVPNEGVTVDAGVGGQDIGIALAVLPLALVFQAGLAAGYFGSIRDALDAGSYAFLSNARRYFLPFLLYTVIPALVLIPLVLVGAGGGVRALAPLVILLIPVIIVVTYLFYATPYLVVLRQTDIVSAARASYALAVSGGPYLHFALGFAAFVLVSSLLATAVVVNLGVVGIALGVVVAAPVGLAANVATMRFVADVDAESPSFGPWVDEDGTPTAEEAPSSDRR